MIKKIQIRIIIIFLLLGILAIGTMGYLSYTNFQGIDPDIIENREESYALFDNYQNQIKLLTLITIGIFTLSCLLIRSFCNESNDSTN